MPQRVEGGWALNFCPRCGTPVVGAYCGNCGAPTSLAHYQVATSDAPGLDEPPTSPDVNVEATSVVVPNDPPTPTEPLRVNASGEVIAGLPLGRARRSLVLETWGVMIAFLLPAVMSAVLVLAEHVSGVVDISRFPSIVHGHPITNMILGIMGYIPVAAPVPLALYLLARTGQDRTTLGLGVPSFTRDVFPGLGIGAAAWGCEIALLAPFAVFLANHKSLIVSVSTHAEPKYYVIWGLAISATTAITEEVLVNGYLITRLGQLGWTPRRALVLSLILRTSYHVYYGVGFLLTVPFGYFVTRSFQKHHKLNRPIVAHFLFDAILITISILR